MSLKAGEIKFGRIGNKVFQLGEISRFERVGETSEILQHRAAIQVNFRRSSEVLFLEFPTGQERDRAFDWLCEACQIVECTGVTEGSLGQGTSGVFPEHVLRNAQ